MFKNKWIQNLKTRVKNKIENKSWDVYGSVVYIEVKKFDFYLRTFVFDDDIFVLFFPPSGRS